MATDVNSEEASNRLVLAGEFKNMEEKELAHRKKDELKKLKKQLLKDRDESEYIEFDEIVEDPEQDGVILQVQITEPFGGHREANAYGKDVLQEMDYIGYQAYERQHKGVWSYTFQFFYLD